ncbi:MAG: Fe-S protein assembly co-chaperone HscB [Caldimonas sp.]
MQFDRDDFELFGLPRRFALDRAELDASRRALQAEVHPDRFAASDAAVRRVAMQWAVRVNEAHERLGNPLKRATYLCELQGTPIAAEDNTAMPAEFLMQQMAWREKLDDARSAAEVQAVAGEVDGQRRSAYARLGQALDDAHDFGQAAQEVRALMFVERFAADVDERLHRLET